MTMIPVSTISQIERTIDSMQYLALIVPLVDGRWKWSVTAFEFQQKGVADTEAQARHAIEQVFTEKGGAV